MVKGPRDLDRSNPAGTSASTADSAGISLEDRVIDRIAGLYAVWDATRKMSVTLKLTISYFDTIRPGTWLEAHPVVVSSEDGIVHVCADLLIDGEKLGARADATFRSLRRTAK